MSVKRQATSDLNHDNWDQEDPTDHEVMGEFKTAPKDVLEKRVMRTAKRRVINKDVEQKKPVFSGFGGFNKVPPSSFDFLANLTNGNKTNGSPVSNSESTQTSGLFSSKSPMLSVFNTSTSTPIAKTIFGTASQSQSSIQESSDCATQSISKTTSSSSDTSFQSQTTSSSTKSTQANTLFPINTVITTQTNSPFSIAASDKNNSSNSINLASSCSASHKTSQSASTIVAKSSEVTKFGIESDIDSNEKINEKKIAYYTKLKGLNESVSDWITKHVKETPLCILTPIFNDYEKYLKEIQDEYNSVSKSSSVECKTHASDSKLELKSKTDKETGITNKSEESGIFSNTKSTSFPALPDNQSNVNASQEKSIFSSGFNKSTSCSIASSKAVSFPSITSQTSSAGAISFGIKNPTATVNTTSLPSFTNTTSTGASTSFSFGVKRPTTTVDSTNVPTFTATTSTNFSFGAKSPTATGTNTSLPSFTSTTSTGPNTGFSFGVKSPTEKGNNTSLPSFTSTTSTTSSGFSFGIKPQQTAATTTTSSLFTTSSLASNSSPSKPFSFSTDKPFSFNTNIQKPDEKKEDNENEEDEEPPKVEFTPLVEKNSVFDKRCKIFVKKDGNYIDKGIGTLYIKKVEDNDKYQLLVRANTTVGNILLNLLLTSSIPIQRLGKNNVMMVCIPTPNSKPPPTPVLIRVKTSEEADALLETLKKYNS